MSVVTEQKSTLRVNADRASCCGYGVCAEICPDVYKLDEAGLIIVDEEILVPVGMEDLAREAAESCPQGCLHLEPIEEE